MTEVGGEDDGGFSRPERDCEVPSPGGERDRDGRSVLSVPGGSTDRREAVEAADVAVGGGTGRAST